MLPPGGTVTLTLYVIPFTLDSVKYENVIIGAIKCNMSDLELWGGKTNGRKTRRLFSLFI